MDKNSFFVLPSSILKESSKTAKKNATVKREYMPFGEYKETYY